MHIASFLWNGLWCALFNKKCRLDQGLTNDILAYTGLGASVFFAFFTFVMLGDQLNMIRKNTSTIDTKK